MIPKAKNLFIEVMTMFSDKNMSKEIQTNPLPFFRNRPNRRSFILGDRRSTCFINLHNSIREIKYLYEDKS